ncbi:MAG TPA: MFS transporter, partial [Firmicutes bacterium]|nr:MFS transporter [Bacillota bacterium]
MKKDKGAEQEAPKSEKLSASTKLAFGFGDVYGGGAIQIVNFFYLIFLTDYIGLRPAYAGIIFFIARGWDAIADPLMGVITDRTRTRFGRRRPYFLAATVLVFVS